MENKFLSKLKKKNLLKRAVALMTTATLATGLFASADLFFPKEEKADAASAFVTEDSSETYSVNLNRFDASNFSKIAFYNRNHPNPLTIFNNSTKGFLTNNSSSSISSTKYTFLFETTEKCTVQYSTISSPYVEGDYKGYRYSTTYKNTECDKLIPYYFYDDFYDDCEDYLYGNIYGDNVSFIRIQDKNQNKNYFHCKKVENWSTIFFDTRNTNGGTIDGKSLNSAYVCNGSTQARAIVSKIINDSVSYKPGTSSSYYYRNYVPYILPYSATNDAFNYGTGSVLNSYDDSDRNTDYTNKQYVILRSQDNSFKINGLDGKIIKDVIPGRTYKISYTDANINNATLFDNPGNYKKYIVGAIYEDADTPIYIGKLNEVTNTSGIANITIPSDLKPQSSYLVAFYEETDYIDCNLATCSFPIVTKFITDSTKSLDITPKSDLKYDEEYTNLSSIIDVTLKSSDGDEMDVLNYYFMTTDDFKAIPASSKASEELFSQAKGLNKISTPTIPNTDNETLSVTVAYFYDEILYYKTFDLKVTSSGASGNISDKDTDNTWITTTQNDITWHYQLDEDKNAVNVYTDSDIESIVTEDGILEIPSTLGKLKYPVKSIGGGTKDTPFISNVYSDFERIEFPDTLTTINDYAFYKCKAALELVIPSQITDIKYSAFYFSNIVSVVSQAKNLTIEQGAFMNCSKLQKVIIKGKKTKIGEYAFAYVSSLKQIILANTVDVGSYAFRKCENLTQLKMDNVTEGTINPYAFEKCTSLASLYLPNTLDVKGYAFNECTGLKSVEIALTEVPANIFANCMNITEIVFDKEVETVAYNWGGYSEKATAGNIAEGGQIVDANIGDDRNIYVRNADTMFQFYRDADGNYYSGLGFMRSNSETEANHNYYRSANIYYASESTVTPTVVSDGSIVQADVPTSQIANVFSRGYKDAEGNTVLTVDLGNKMITACNAMGYSAPKDASDSNSAKDKMENATNKITTKQTGIEANYPAKVNVASSIKKSTFSVYPVYNDGTPYDDVYTTDDYYIVDEDTYNNLKSNDKLFADDKLIASEEDFKAAIGDDTTIKTNEIPDGETSTTQNVVVVVFETLTTEEGETSVVFTTTVPVKLVTTSSSYSELLDKYGSAEEIAKKIDELNKDVEDYTDSLIDVTNKINESLGIDKKVTDKMTETEITKAYEEAIAKLIEKADKAGNSKSAKIILDCIVNELKEEVSYKDGETTYVYSSSETYTDDQYSTFLEKATSAIKNAAVTSSDLQIMVAQYKSLVEKLDTMMGTAKEATLEDILDTTNGTKIYLNGDWYTVLGGTVEDEAVISYKGDDNATVIVKDNKVTVTYQKDGEAATDTYTIEIQSMYNRMAGKLAAISTKLSALEKGLSSIEALLDKALSDLNLSADVTEGDDVDTRVSNVKAEINALVEEITALRKKVQALESNDIAGLYAQLEAYEKSYNDLVKQLEKLMNAPVDNKDAYISKDEETGETKVYVGNDTEIPVKEKTDENGDVVYKEIVNPKTGETEKVIVYIGTGDFDGDGKEETKEFYIDDNGIHIIDKDGNETGEVYTATDIELIERKAAAQLAELQGQLSKLEAQLKMYEATFATIREALGLPEDATDEEVIEKISEIVALNNKLSGDNVTLREQNATLEAYVDILKGQLKAADITPATQPPVVTIAPTNEAGEPIVPEVPTVTEKPVVTDVPDVTDVPASTKDPVIDVTVAPTKVPDKATEVPVVPTKVPENKETEAPVVPTKVPDNPEPTPIIINNTEEVTKLKAQISELQSQNSALKKDVAELTKANSDLVTAKSTLESSNSKLTADVSKLTTDNAALTKNNSTLSADKAKLETENKELVTENEALTASNSTLTSQNATLTKKNSTLTSTNKTLKSQNRSLTSKNSTLSNKVNSLQKTNSSLTSQVSSLKSQLASANKGGSNGGGNSVPSYTIKPYNPTNPTVAPKKTISPKVTTKPNVTAKPSITTAPEVTFMPEVTEEPVITFPTDTESPNRRGEDEFRGTDDPSETGSPEKSGKSGNGTMKLLYIILAFGAMIAVGVGAKLYFDKKKAAGTGDTEDGDDDIDVEEEDDDEIEDEEEEE